MKLLRHNGILVLKPPEPHDLRIRINGNEMLLDQTQEEMAVAWVRKIGTTYADDPIFKKNFSKDFAKALGLKNPPKIDDIDFSQVVHLVEAERARKEAMTKEEKKAAREERKIERERLKELYGYVWVDDERMELSNYQTEPSGIFMGRGEHPLRGRWKSGATEKDITLNHSPEDRPEGNWCEIIWAPDTMWIAKWTDELTGKTKYIWLHDSTPIKQEREEAKFDKAIKLGRQTKEIREHILNGLHSEDPKRRMVAAACYLIERLSLRVGDEKDPDEADTVGATTLRVEHLTFKPTSVVFDFLGKDSVAWHKEMEMSEDIYAVFKELYDRAIEKTESFRSGGRSRSRADPKKVAQIFPSIRSTHVNRFLNEFDPELTAKVFRTFQATMMMQDELKRGRVKRVHHDFIKKAAFKRANLEVARVMNHTKQAPKGWSNTESRYQERLKKTDSRTTTAKKYLRDKKKRLTTLKKKEKIALDKRKDTVSRQKVSVEKNKQIVASWREKRDRAKATWDNARDTKRKSRASKRKSTRTKKERLEEAQGRIERTRSILDRAEDALSKARVRYDRSKVSLARSQDAHSGFREKSVERIARAEKTVSTAKDRVKKAEIAKEKIKTDLALAKASRTWNLGTSLKSYIHPRIIYRWCQRIEYNWRKVYPSTLQRKFAWVEK